jgi:hypothetical protein
MIKKLISIVSLMALVLSLGACKSAKKSVGSYYTSEIECMGTELDGSETLLTWGTGKNKKDALAQARKNAVKAVLFKGVTKGYNGCSMRPLITEVNAMRKYEDYFNSFFKDGGAYTEFVSNKDTRKSSMTGEANNNQHKYGIVVRVLRAELKNKLIEDNILKN